MNLTQSERRELKNWLFPKCRVNVVNGCWEWSGGLNKGYPTSHKTIRGKRRFAHVVGAVLSTGRLPNEREYASHTCHNPSCCAPHHLVFESQSENLSRSSKVMSKGQRKRYEDTAERQKTGDATRKRFEDPTERAKSSEALRNSDKLKEAMRSRDCNVIRDMEHANEIRRQYATGKYTYQELAILHRCTKGTIYGIINNRTWRE